MKRHGFPVLRTIKVVNVTAVQCMLIATRCTEKFVHSLGKKNHRNRNINKLPHVISVHVRDKLRRFTSSFTCNYCVFRILSFFFALSIFLSKKQVSGNVIRIKKNFPTKLQNGHVVRSFDEPSSVLNTHEIK